MTKTPPSGPARSGDLEALLDLERRLADRLAAAQAEADRILREAHEAAGRREAGLEAELTAAANALDARLRVERERRLAAVAEEGRQRVAGWDGTDDATIAHAAGAVVDALVAGPRGARR